ncbi:hypothetical protein [Actinomadura rifamycini]|uniref:hypothetical protein n=1 Tax=Actinomadura rifamycini TaxID=31962 RepID=UPI0012F89563|nr:hypothetical protein [Actinomadura rifamycini]
MPGRDDEAVLAEVRRVLPGAVAWAGEYTGSFWLLRSDRLEEFADGRALLARVRGLAVPWPPPPAPKARRTDVRHGAATGPPNRRPAAPPRRVPARRRDDDPFFPPPNRVRRFLGRCGALLGRVDAAR